MMLKGHSIYLETKCRSRLRSAVCAVGGGVVPCVSVAPFLIVAWAEPTGAVQTHRIKPPFSEMSS
eukprot:6024719-Pyramimonas_sp.AAC.1